MAKISNASKGLDFIIPLRRVFNDTENIWKQFQNTIYILSYFSYLE